MNSFEWEEATISQLQEQMSAGSLTAESFARQYLDRIESINRRGPSLHAVI